MAFDLHWRKFNQNNASSFQRDPVRNNKNVDSMPWECERDKNSWKKGVNFCLRIILDNLRVSIDEPTAIATALKTIQFTANSMVIRIFLFRLSFRFCFDSLITQTRRRQFLNALFYYFCFFFCLSCLFSEAISLCRTTTFLCRFGAGGRLPNFETNTRQINKMHTNWNYSILVLKCARFWLDRCLRRYHTN